MSVSQNVFLVQPARGCNDTLLSRSRRACQMQTTKWTAWLGGWVHDRSTRRYTVHEWGLYFKSKFERGKEHFLYFLYFPKKKKKAGISAFKVTRHTESLGFVLLAFMYLYLKKREKNLKKEPQDRPKKKAWSSHKEKCEVCARYHVFNYSKKNPLLLFDFPQKCPQNCQHYI